MISRLVNENGVLGTLLNSIENNERISVFGCGKGEKLTILAESGKFVLFVCEDEKTAYEYKEKFESINYGCEVLCDKDSFNERFANFDKTLEMLRKINKNQINALIITPAVLFKNLPNVKYLKDSITKVVVGDNIDVDDVTKLLIAFGFEKREYLEKPKQFLVRGDVLELYLDNENYYRLMFSYGELEKIKKCNYVTLLPVEELKELNINNYNYLQIDEVKLNDYITKNAGLYSDVLKEHYKDKNNLLLYLPFAKNMGGSIFDYLPEDSVIAINDSKSVYVNMLEFVNSFNDDLKSLIKEGKLSKAFNEYVLNKDVNFPAETSLVVFQYITNANKFFSPQKVFNISSSPSVSYVGKNNLLLQDILINRKTDNTFVLFAKTNENVRKLTKLLDENRINYTIANTSLNIIKNNINILPKNFGVSARFNDEGVFVIGSDDLFVKAKKVAVSSETSFSEAFLPEINDYVVHNYHGIGKYLGVKRLDLNGGKRDFFVVEYKNNDVLYLPVESLSNLSKYVGSDKSPKLNKLGGGEFVKTKESVKRRIKESAINLVELYAQRQNLKGFKYPKDDEMILQFENDFGYTETADQLNAINDVKADMENGRLMDRLICGDVGYGKTEVALRTAFKTIMAGKQVAFLCPTTILSQQHFNTALIRFKNYGVIVAVLNRFKTEKECEQIYKQISDAKVDMVVGTHKLLNKKVMFKNLGLLILDEEQKFGVEDKEYIKNLKNSVNVLTLSATPIPRTLHMSLVGIRDISIIETPPTSRIPVQVSVVEFNESIIINSVKRELERDGQVLIIYNKVESIYSFAAKVKAMLNSDVKIDVAHGQMMEKELENAISRLYNGETDVLISTTLIENGVDLPNANTLIVINSDMLGLSQLYQLKGRIGRGDRQAFAYFTYDGGKLLNENAYKRLEAISQYTSMGSGFKIALKDLEIRGGGNVLGVEQSGHMEKVGYALYLQLLNEAITEVKGGVVKVASDVKIETSLPAFIPNDFENSYNARISLYSKVSKIKSLEELQKMISNFNEIYGTVPEEVTNLCKISLIRYFASNVLAEKVIIKPTTASIVFSKIDDLNKEVVNALNVFEDFAVSNMENKPIINLSTHSESSVLDLVINFLQCCQS